MEKWHDITSAFDNLKEDEKIVDIVYGCRVAGVVTDKGRLIVRNYLFYREVPCKIQESNNEDNAFEITLPDGYKAEKVWMGSKKYIIYVTGLKEDGTKKTFIWRQEGGQTELFPLGVPEGVYF